MLLEVFRMQEQEDAELNKNLNGWKWICVKCRLSIWKEKDFDKM